MDFSDINKVANSKKINADAERLKEKVARETANIIKLKVALDTAAWEAREQRHESERLAARLRDELRLRPDATRLAERAAAETAGARAQLAAAAAEAERELDRREALGAELARRAAALVDAERAAAALMEELRQGTAACAVAAAELERGAREAAALRAAFEGEEERRRRELAAVVAGLERELSAVGERENEELARELRDKELENETREFALIEEKGALEEEINTLRDQRDGLAEKNNALQEEKDALQKQIDDLSLKSKVLQAEQLRALGAVERLTRELHAQVVWSEKHAPPAAPRDPPGHEERAPPAPAPSLASAPDLSLAPAPARPSFFRADSLLGDFNDSGSSMELNDVSFALRTPPGTRCLFEEAPGAGRHGGTPARVEEAVPRAGSPLPSPCCSEAVPRAGKRPLAASPLPSPRCSEAVPRAGKRPLAASPLPSPRCSEAVPRAGKLPLAASPLPSPRCSEAVPHTGKLPRAGKRPLAASPLPAARRHEPERAPRPRRFFKTRRSEREADGQK